MSLKWESFADVSFKFKKSSKYGYTMNTLDIHIRNSILLLATAHFIRVWL